MINKAKYIKTVKSRLNVPNDLKNSVLEELYEAFDCAKEHGESESDLIRRLGTPKEFADDVMKNADLTEEQKKCIKQRKNIFKLIIAFVIGAVILTGYFIFCRMSMGNIIGYADASTNIQVFGGVGNILPVLFCVLLWAVTICLIVYSFYLKIKFNRQ